MYNAVVTVPRAGRYYKAEAESDMRRWSELSRRGLLGSVCTGSALRLLDAEPPQSPRLRIWDVHTHLHSVPGDTPETRMEVLVRCMDRLGIERIILSQGYITEIQPSADLIRTENDRVMAAVRRFPARAYGSVYLSPKFLDFSLREFDRCVRDGPMVGVGELEVAMRCNA